MNFIKAITLSNMLLSSVAPIAAFTTREAATVKTAIEQTSPLADLEEDSAFKTAYDGGAYNKANLTTNDPKDGIYPLQLAEWHYGYSDYGLYFYIWNKTQYDGYDLKSVLNGITIQNLKTGSYSMYPISYVSGNGNQFYKFKINVSELDSMTYLDKDGSRRYSLGEVLLKKKSSPDGLATAYKYGKAYVYTGSLSNETLAMDQDDLEVLNTNVHTGTYMTQAKESNTFNHHELHYVYFNIPNEYDIFGELVEYHFTYYPIPLAPILCIQGEELTNSQINNASNVLAIGNNNYYGRYQYFKKNSINYQSVSTNNGWSSDEYGIALAYVDNNTTNYYGVLAERIFGMANVVGSVALAFVTYGIGSIASLGTPAIWAHSMLLEGDGQENLRNAYIPNSWYSNLNAIAISNGTNDVSSKQLDEYINFNNLGSWANYAVNQELKNKYNTFNKYLDACFVEEHLRYDQESYKLDTYGKNAVSFAKNGMTNPESADAWSEFAIGQEVIKPIEKITSSNIDTDETNWKLEIGTAQEFNQTFNDAQNNNQSTYIFRFAPTTSVCYPVYWTKVGDGGAPWDILDLFKGVVWNCDRIGSLYIGTGIYNLTSLDITFARDGVETIIPICADPKNINPRINSPVDDSPNSGCNSGDIRKVLSMILTVTLIILAAWLIIKLIGWINKARSKKR